MTPALPAFAACETDRRICEDLRAEAVTAAPRAGVWRLLLSGAAADPVAENDAADDAAAEAAEPADTAATPCLADPKDPDVVRFVVEDATTGPSIMAGMLKALSSETMRVRVAFRLDDVGKACIANRVTFKR